MHTIPKTLHIFVLPNSHIKTAKLLGIAISSHLGGAFLNSFPALLLLSMSVWRHERASLFLFNNFLNTIVQCQTGMKRVLMCNILHPAPSCRASYVPNLQPISWLVILKRRKSNLELTADACTYGYSCRTNASSGSMPIPWIDSTSTWRGLTLNAVLSINQSII